MLAIVLINVYSVIGLCFASLLQSFLCICLVVGLACSVLISFWSVVNSQS